MSIRNWFWWSGLMDYGVTLKWQELRRVCKAPEVTFRFSANSDWRRMVSFGSAAVGTFRMKFFLFFLSTGTANISPNEVNYFITSAPTARSFMIRITTKKACECINKVHTRSASTKHLPARYETIDIVAVDASGFACYAIIITPSNSSFKILLQILGESLFKDATQVNIMFRNWRIERAYHIGVNNITIMKWEPLIDDAGSNISMRRSNYGRFLVKMRLCLNFSVSCFQNLRKANELIALLLSSAQETKYRRPSRVDNWTS